MVAETKNKQIKPNWFAETVITPLHRTAVASRRVRQISCHLAALIPEEGEFTGLDVGSGAGELALSLMEHSPRLKLAGVDILIRPDSVIPVKQFDGITLPFGDNEFDFSIVCDVLHHTDDPHQLLRECARVSRKYVLIKDHLCENSWDRIRLSIMDWVGNRGHGVRLPYNYLSASAWRELAEAVQLRKEEETNDLRLYIQPMSLIFDGNLHFIARYLIESGGPGTTLADK